MITTYLVYLCHCGHELLIPYNNDIAAIIEPCRVCGKGAMYLMGNRRVEVLQTVPVGECIFCSGTRLVGGLPCACTVEYPR